jgi:hypothetical protein
MRKKLQVADLGDFLKQPLNAVLATYLPSGDVLLTPAWHEWRDGGFSFVILADDVKDRDFRHDPRASLVVESMVGWAAGLNCGASHALPATAWTRSTGGLRRAI